MPSAPDLRSRCLAVPLAVLLLCAAPAASEGEGKSLPAPDVVKKAEALVRELYAKEYDRAKKDALERSHLAATLLQEARETRDYPAGRYVLYREARDLAADAGDLATALQAIDELALAFPLPQGDAFAMKVEALARVSQASAAPEAHRAAADAALILLDDALAADDFPAALRLLATAEIAGIKLRSVPLVSAVRTRKEEVVAQKVAFDKVKPYLDRLRAAPADAVANLAVGKYHALVKGDWEKGLPYLARSRDPTYGALAADEASPAARSDASTQVKLAEGWKRAAGQLKGIEQVHALLRSYHWYQQARTGAKAPAALRTIDDGMRAVNDALPPAYRAGEIAREVRSLKGHAGPVFAVAFSSDGKRLVSGGQDGTVIVWDARTGKVVRRLTGHSGPVWCVAFAPDGKRVLSGSFDKTIRLWDLASGRDVRRFEGHEDYVRSVAFSADGRLILSAGDDRTIRLWQVESGAELAQSSAHEHFVWSVAFAGGSQAASASLDRTVRIWQVSPFVPSRSAGKWQESHKLTGHADTVLAVAISPDGRQVLSGSTDRTVRLWDLESGKQLAVLKGHSGYVTSVAFAPDGRRALTAGYDRTVRLWDLTSNQEIRTLEGHADRVWSVAFAPDGRLAASAGHDGTVRLWGN